MAFPQSVGCLAAWGCVPSSIHVSSALTAFGDWTKTKQHAIEHNNGLILIDKVIPFLIPARTIYIRTLIFSDI